MLDECRVGLLAVDVPLELGRRLRAERRAVDVNLVAEVVPKEKKMGILGYVAKVEKRTKSTTVISLFSLFSNSGKMQSAIFDYFLTSGTLLR